MNSIERLRENPVYFYTFGYPNPSGSGTAIRQYTNIRAYLDLGFSVKVIHFSKLNQSNQLIILPQGATLEEVVCDHEHLSLLSRIAYKLGFPKRNILSVMYADRKTIIGEVKKRENRIPGSIHHFEYLATANAAINLKAVNSIWSCHDWPSDRYRKIASFREQIGIRKGEREKRRKYKYLRKIEQATASHSKLVLTIADHERRYCSKEWGLTNIQHLPMSWPDENIVQRNRQWIQGGKLRLLHLGSIDALVGYTSLKYIIEGVFSLLPGDVLSRIELIVAGSIGNSEYSKNIIALTKPYAQVQFVGFVDDVKSIYSDVDLHLVGSENVTGLRTRIIESFVYGLPVLSTFAAAEGIVGITDNENILLADSASSFAKKIIDLFDNSSILPKLAAGGRKVYDLNYSRRVSSDKLAHFLEKYL